MDADPDPAYHFFADPDFYLMRIWMRIQVTKMMLIRIHNAAFDAFFFFFLLRENLSLKESLEAAETGLEQARNALERQRQEQLQEKELLRLELQQGAAQPAGFVAAQLLSALKTCQNQLPDQVR